MKETSYYGGIHSITKDSIGRIWFSGYDALFVYDGNSFVQMNDLVTCHSPMSHWTYGQVITDKSGQLYVATNHGLLHFDYQTKKFDRVLDGNMGALTSGTDGSVWMIRNNKVESFYPAPADIKRHPLPDSVIPTVLRESRKSVFVASERKLYEWNDQTERYILFADLGSSGSWIRDILEFDGSTYILTDTDGLYVCDGNGQVTKHYTLHPEYGKSTQAKQLYLDTTGIVWIATQSGLFLFDPLTEEMRLLRSNLHYPYSLPNNSVWCIYPDPDGGVWIGTYGGKLAYMSFSDNDINYFKATSGGLNHPIVSCFEEDKQGNLWIGTEGGGVNYWNRKTDQFSYYTGENNTGITSNLIKTLHYDRAKEILRVATFNGGMRQFDNRKQHFVDLQMYLPGTSKPLSVYDFAPEGNRGVWMTNPDAELVYKDWEKGTTENVIITDAEGKVVDMNIETLFLDNDGRLWLMTYEGLYIVDIHTRRIEKHYYLDNAPYRVNNLYSYCIASDSTVWLGTHGGGINRLGKDGSYVNFGEEDGLFGKTVFGILEDTTTGDIWFSTNDGLYYYDCSNRKIVKSHIDSPDLCGAFYVRSCFKTSKGEMLFGGTDGFIMFTPANIKQNNLKPRVFFTGLLINNKKIIPGDRDSPIDRDISTLSYSGNRGNRIELSHKQSNIEIRVSANSYLQAAKNQYAYRMLGLSDHWYVLPQGQKSVQFFNLPPGEYEFEIKAANNDGLWGDHVSSLYFEISPSPFLSGWAYTVYALLFLGIAYVIWMYFTNKKIFRHRLRMEQLKEQNMRRLTQARINFFTNISHDLKTPLTLVMDPLKQLKELLPGQKAPGANAYVSLIENNVNRIQRMISQLLQFREIESQKITLDEKPGDLIRYISDIFSLFRTYAGKRGITTEMNTEIEQFHTRFDHDVIEKIFTNLFSNAIKYNMPNGYVGVRISTVSREQRINLEISERPDAGYIAVAITNTGTAIPDDKKEAIFESFNRLISGKPAFEKGTGLGLAIVRELVDYLGGRISLNSGTSEVTFTIVLPFARSIAETDNNIPAYEHTISEIAYIMAGSAETVPPGKNRRKAYSVVVMEDDPELREYMKQQLSEYYNVYTAVNGQEGIRMAEKIFPRVVITDLMMPEADGFDVCRKLRSHIKTSHIPIVVLSALGENTQNKIKALESGANVFLNKPFDMKYLIQQIGNLIENQNRMKEWYSKKYTAQPSKVTISSTDEQLLGAALKHIEDNIGNMDYNVESFVSDMGIGRTLLYQKMNDILGMSIKEFIMDIRLKRSAQLLRDSDLTISEISYATGFKNPKYFSTCFRKQYNVTPSEFRNQL
ncbi:hybrid sensor histidine kinase/response regulator transcription factor [Sinomicrobium soli]|uniref:hybrid sensor histidine kinase/response regulator transcription factor n=1 Tax=Sinomicrobium sp. N-1-3-6 TaxID=2219864 RepID=UPI000DCD05AD|nr:two-component regulator propeller domain-containing protein [Sinomicrobium sp. N-1-3-6]RAV31021.1 hybrid sensor histidine kinase/response regulator [Sinomicrobium sp. N-1-3-6]